MSIVQIIFSTEFISALASYSLLIVAGLLLFDRVHSAVDNTVLAWPWNEIGMPLLRACLMLVFIGFCYPVLFGLNEGPALNELLGRGEGRVNLVVNILFLIALLFPLIPVIGNWHELVLPLQGITACGLLFSWLATENGLQSVDYIPAGDTLFYIVVIAIISHWLSQRLSLELGESLDKALNVKDSGFFLSRAIVLFMQSPAILLYSLTLGRQLQQIS